MKSYFYLLLSILLSGCGIPSSIYHGVRVSSERGSAVRLDQLGPEVRIHDERLAGFTASQFERVVVFARLPDEAESTPRPVNGQAVGERLPPSSRHVVESVVLQSLLAKGYRGASRMNLRQTEIEQGFPDGFRARETLARLFKGQRILIVTVNEFKTAPKEYSRYSFWSSGERRYPIGTHLVAQITADLIDADNSESRWVATASVETVMASSPSPAGVLEEMVGLLADRIPTANSHEISQAP